MPAPAARAAASSLVRQCRHQAGRPGEQTVGAGDDRLGPLVEADRSRRGIDQDHAEIDMVERGAGIGGAEVGAVEALAQVKGAGEMGHHRLQRRDVAIGEILRAQHAADGDVAGVGRRPLHQRHRAVEVAVRPHHLVVELRPHEVVLGLQGQAAHHLAERQPRRPGGHPAGAGRRHAGEMGGIPLPADHQLGPLLRPILDQQRPARGVGGSGDGRDRAGPGVGRHRGVVDPLHRPKDCVRPIHPRPAARADCARSEQT